VRPAGGTGSGEFDDVSGGVSCAHLTAAKLPSTSAGLVAVIHVVRTISIVLDSDLAVTFAVEALNAQGQAGALQQQQPPLRQASGGAFQRPAKRRRPPGHRRSP